MELLPIIWYASHGKLLKRRALELINLEEITLEELIGKEEVVEGTITIGCGEFAAVEILAGARLDVILREMASSFFEKAYFFVCKIF